jgi:hypothetical protein
MLETSSNKCSACKTFFLYKAELKVHIEVHSMENLFLYGSEVELLPVTPSLLLRHKKPHFL